MSAPPLQQNPPFTVCHISLAHKPGAKIAYTFVPAKVSSSSKTGLQPLLVFLNGLGLPQAVWYPTITLLSSLPAHPAILAYDRYGQGATTDRDPLDAKAEDPKHGHTVSDVVQDLHFLLEDISTLHGLKQNGELPPLLLIGNSIGCATARRYAGMYPNTVIGLLLLDSVFANTDFVSVFPDPETVTQELPEGVTLDGLRSTREVVRKIFHPEQGSAEGLSRRNLKELLPDSDGPRLVYTEGGKDLGPWVTVVGHGWDKFADDTQKTMGIPIAITQNYTNPQWHDYNVGLTKITSPERARGPILAENAAHFIQKDDPELVFEELKLLLSNIGYDGI